MSQLADITIDAEGYNQPRSMPPVDASADSWQPWTEGDIEQSIPARFEQQASRYGRRIAVKSGATQLTYNELNRAANRLAHAILAERGPQGEPVALLIEHGSSMIVAILAALKASKIFVPIDPAHPQGRIGTMLADAQAAVLIASNMHMALAHEVAAGSRTILNVDAVDPSLPDHNPPHAIAPDAPLNIMYTSGSTGQPKGVLQMHRNVLHDVRSTSNFLRLRPDDRVGLLTSYSFGASTATICNALMNGATLLPFDLKRQGVHALAGWLRDERITIYHSVPTVFRHLLRSLHDSDRFPHMRAIQLGGEPVYKRDVALFRKHFPATCSFRVGLGSTEALLATWYLVGDEDDIPGAVVPVGYPTAGREILLVDEAGDSVPSGEVGEVVVKSRYLSPGYWRQPDQTAAAFVPASDGSDTRLYRTGDLGRLLPDGRLEHLGRKDFQVKVRGHRIEVSEIEMRLLDLPGVAEAAVVVRMDHLGENRLVGYVVPAANAAPSPGELRRAVAEALPDYMVPAAFVLIDSLPLLPFGKVDRNALPAPDWGQPDAGSEYVAPRTPVEESLAQIWIDVLVLRRVSIHDNFFDLGGNSLLAAQIIARTTSAFQIELSLNDFFDAPTIVSQALVIAQRLAASAPDDDLASLLAELELISDDEVQQRLSGDQAQV